MGADLCLAIVEVPASYNDPKAEQPFPTSFRFDDFLNDLSEYVKNLSDSLAYDMTHWIGYEGDNPHAELLAAIEDFRKCSDYRDVGIINVHGGFVFVTGGMTWGDDPTDSFTTLSIVGEIAQHMAKK